MEWSATSWRISIEINSQCFSCLWTAITLKNKRTNINIWPWLQIKQLRVAWLGSHMYVHCTDIAVWSGHDPHPQHWLGHRQLVITSISVITVTQGWSTQNGFDINCQCKHHLWYCGGVTRTGAGTGTGNKQICQTSKRKCRLWICSRSIFMNAESSDKKLLAIKNSQ